MNINHSRESRGIAEDDARSAYLSESIAATYEATRFSSVKGRIYERLQRWALARSMRSIEGGSIVLDMPCGTGRLIGGLRQRGFRVIAADISPAMIGRARARHAGRAGFLGACMLDGAAMPLPDSSVDAVVCIKLMHLIPDGPKAAILGELGRVTRRHLVIGFGYTGPAARLKRLAKRAIFSRATIPDYPLPLGQIRGLLRASGFEVISMRYTFAFFSEEVIVHAEKR